MQTYRYLDTKHVPVSPSIFSFLPPALVRPFRDSVSQWHSSSLALLFCSSSHCTGSDKSHLPGSCETLSTLTFISLPPSCPKFHTHDTEAQLEMKNMVHYLGSAEKNVMALFSSCFYAFKNMLISFFM